jgi:hypothetical protein
MVATGGFTDLSRRSGSLRQRTRVQMDVAGRRLRLRTERTRPCARQTADQGFLRSVRGRPGWPGWPSHRAEDLERMTFRITVLGGEARRPAKAMFARILPWRDALILVRRGPRATRYRWSRPRANGGPEPL